MSVDIPVDLNKIVQFLQGEPFRREVSVSILDSLENQQRLQLLSDILAELSGCEPNQGPDIQEETQHITVARILTNLGHLGFNPNLHIESKEQGKSEIDSTEFRIRLVNGEQYLIFKIIEFLIVNNNVENMKTKAYLAKYLVDLEIPNEILSDPDIQAKLAAFNHDKEVFKNEHKKLKELTDKTNEINKMDGGEGPGSQGLNGHAGPAGSGTNPKNIRSKANELAKEVEILKQRLTKKEAMVNQLKINEKTKNELIMLNNLNIELENKKRSIAYESDIENKQKVEIDKQEIIHKQLCLEMENLDHGTHYANKLMHDVNSVDFKLKQGMSLRENKDNEYNMLNSLLNNEIGSTERIKLDSLRERLASDEFIKFDGFNLIKF